MVVGWRSFAGKATGADAHGGKRGHNCRGLGGVTFGSKLRSTARCVQRRARRQHVGEMDVPSEKIGQSFAGAGMMPRPRPRSTERGSGSSVSALAPQSVSVLAAHMASIGIFDRRMMLSTIAIEQTPIRPPGAVRIAAAQQAQQRLSFVVDAGLGCGDIAIVAVIVPDDSRRTSVVQNSNGFK